MLVTIDYLLPYEVVKDMKYIGISIDGVYHYLKIYDIDFIGDEGCRVTFQKYVK